MNEPKPNRPITILVADDDRDDQLMIRDSFTEARLANPVNFVEDGQELMDYLQRTGKYRHLASDPLPGLILLDLNMPRKDGREALLEIKSDPLLRKIPVVVFTTSKAEEDILRTYDLGVNSFICKPLSFDALVEIVQTLTKYWLEIMKLPN